MDIILLLLLYVIVFFTLMVIASPVLADMADQEETWHSLPMPEGISQLIHMPYGEEMDETVHEQINDWIEKELPGTRSGYWYYKDRNTDTHWPSNYTIAVYDLETKQFYYYEYDS